MVTRFFALCFLSRKIPAEKAEGFLFWFLRKISQIELEEKKMTIYDELKRRGLIAQVTDEQEIKELIYELNGRYPGLKARAFGAMQRLPLPAWGPVEHRRRPLPEDPDDISAV